MQVRLTQGRFALIDKEDYAKIQGYSWEYMRYKSGNEYAVAYKYRPGLKRIRVRMHHLILLPKEGFTTDHISGDGLDNRKSNLRYATHAQQCMNRRHLAQTSSKYKGVTFEPRLITNPWRAQLHCRIAGKSKALHSSFHPTQEAAARAYNTAALQHFGEFARVNKGLE